MKRIQRIVGWILVLVLCAAQILIPAPIQANASEAETVSVSSAADTEIQNGVTLHCWNWSFTNIEANIANIASQGYTAIQVSPIQQAKQATAGYSMSDWWVFYQPASFSIDDTGSSALGTKAEFTRMCETAHEYGLYVIVDVVANHMGDNGGNNKSSAIIDDLENDSSCWHDISKNIDNYYDRYNITQYCMNGVPDLNTASDKVQNYVLNYLKECIDAGADGFRFDAAKHIETPDDDASFSSDFWPTVIDGAEAYAKTARGIDLYCYGEVLNHADENVYLPDSAYTKYFSVTDNSWSNTVRNTVVNGQNAGSFSYSYHKNAEASQLVLWAESHDNYAGDGSSGISVQNINKTWALVAARADAMSLYLARPENFYPQKLGEASMTGWNYDEVRAINLFHNAFAGQSEWVANQGNIAYVERGTSGAILVNCVGTSTSVSVTANMMADGTYIDQITGNTFQVANGKITGNIGSTGIAVVYNASVCEHASHDTAGVCTECSVYVGHDYDADGVCSCGVVKAAERVIYFKNTANWSDVNIYSWYTSGEEITAAWPGDKMTLVGEGVYSYSIPGDASSVIFNYNGAQTDDLTLPTLESGKNMYNYSTDTWETYTEDTGSDDGTACYLFGWINGQNYACEENASIMGDYKFVDGKLTTTFASDSYVGVKKENNEGWYMTNGWLGTDVTCATLYNTSVTGQNSDKFYVPGGVQVTFTLVDNGDDTFTLSYRTGECSHEVHDQSGKCTECGEAVEHSWSAGVCSVCQLVCQHSSYVGGLCNVCGEAKPVSVPTITPAYPTLVFEDVIMMNVYFQVSDLEDVKEMGLITYSQSVSDYNVSSADQVIPGCAWSENDGLYYVTTSAIAPKNLGDKIYFSVYAQLSDGSYVYTDLLCYSPSTYAYNLLNGSGSTETKTLVAAMLNYGAAAQSFFGYNTESLVNANMTDTHKMLLAAYNANMIDDVDGITTEKMGSFANNGGFSKRYPSIGFEGAFEINYYFTPAYELVGSVTLYYWNEADCALADVLTTENATASMTMTGEGELLATVGGIAAKDLDNTVYVAAVYTDIDGNIQTSGVLAYSIGAYCETLAAGTSTAQPLAAATGVYGYYAKQLFGN